MQSALIQLAICIDSVSEKEAAIYTTSLTQTALQTQVQAKPEKNKKAQKKSVISSALDWLDWNDKAAIASSVAVVVGFGAIRWFTGSPDTTQFSHTVPRTIETQIKGWERQTSYFNVAYAHYLQEYKYDDLYKKVQYIKRFGSPYWANVLNNVIPEFKALERYTVHAQDAGYIGAVINGIGYIKGDQKEVLFKKFLVPKNQDPCISRPEIDDVEKWESDEHFSEQYQARLRQVTIIGNALTEVIRNIDNVEKFLAKAKANLTGLDRIQYLMLQKELEKQQATMKHAEREIERVYIEARKIARVEKQMVKGVCIVKDPATWWIVNADRRSNAIDSVFSPGPEDGEFYEDPGSLASPSEDKSRKRVVLNILEVWNQCIDVQKSNLNKNFYRIMSCQPDDLDKTCDERNVLAQIEHLKNFNFKDNILNKEVGVEQDGNCRTRGWYADNSLAKFSPISDSLCDVLHKLKQKRNYLMDAASSWAYSKSKWATARELPQVAAALFLLGSAYIFVVHPWKQSLARIRLNKAASVLKRLVKHEADRYNAKAKRVAKQNQKARKQKRLKKRKITHLSQPDLFKQWIQLEGNNLRKESFEPATFGKKLKVLCSAFKYRSVVYEYFLKHIQRDLKLTDEELRGSIVADEQVENFEEQVQGFMDDYVARYESNDHTNPANLVSDDLQNSEQSQD